VCKHSYDDAGRNEADSEQDSTDVGSFSP
jgi:hypothetical protein